MSYPGNYDPLLDPYYIIKSTIRELPGKVFFAYCHMGFRDTQIGVAFSEDRTMWKDVHWYDNGCYYYYFVEGHTNHCFQRLEDVVTFAAHKLRDDIRRMGRLE